MTVLDAYAIVAYLRGERCAGSVATLLRSPTVVTAVNAAEVFDQLTRVFGQAEDDVHASLGLLSQAGMRIVPVSAELGLFASQLRSRHYHRQHRAVSLADCVAAAMALSCDVPLATADPALAAVTRAEAGRVHGLDDSSGKRP